MPFTQNPIPTFSQAQMLLTLPPVGGMYFFYNTDQANELYSMDASGNFVFVSSDEDCACEISEEWMQGLACALKDGSITAAEYQAAITQGIVVSDINTGGNHVVSISTPFQPVTSVTVTPSVLPILAIGNASQLVGVVLPANADQRVIWVSSNPAFATVTQGGLVVGVAIGVAIITCYSIADPTKFDICTVNVI